MSEIPDRLSAALADRYVIEREIGQGGMATVYLADDVKHSRKVALKILRPELAAVIGADRFLNEVTVTANLQHPHILQLYDSGEADGLLYYVMPYVEGESLRDRLNRERQLSLEATIDLTRAIASALDYAHKRGVIHRDIKPENILLVDDQPIVADFGIALAVSEAGGTRLTETGLSLGTPHYMSPEQATGDRNVDARSDVYALACMVYEMLVGEPPFTGPTAQAIIAKVITETPPPLLVHRSSVPPHMEAAIHKALSKVPADRFATPQAFVEALGRAGQTTRTTALRAPTTLERALRGAGAFLWRPGVAWGATLLVAAGAFGLLRFMARPAGSSRPVARFAVRLPPEERISAVGVRVASDGDMVILEARSRAGPSRLVRRALEDEAVTPIEGTASGRRPFLSPDGAWVAFEAEGKLRKVRVSGGTPVDLADALWGGGDWGPDGRIVYTQSYQSGLWQVSADGADARMLSEPDTARGELGHWWPQILPQNRGILFTAFSTPIARARIDVLRPDGQRVSVVEGAVFARYLPTGHILFQRDRTILAAPFDLRQLTVTGSAVPVVEDVALLASDGMGGYSVSENGTLVYLKASVWASPGQLVWVDRRGTETPALDRLAQYRQYRLSPDGRRLALTIVDGASDVWIYEFGREIFTRLTRHGSEAFNPIWTADARRIVYSAETPVFDLFIRAADGSGSADTLLLSPNDKYGGSITPDGQDLVYTVVGLRGDLAMASLDSSSEPRTLVATPFNEGGPEVSPDGQWLAFESDASGRAEVYVVAFPAADRRTQISTDGGTDPMWLRDGRELAYRSDNRMMLVTFDSRTGEASRPRELFRGDYAAAEIGGGYTRTYDASADGERFLMMRIPDASQPRDVTVILNWFDELKVKMAAAR